MVNLLQNEQVMFGTYQDFLDDCDANQLPDYSFIEPNYKDHADSTGAMLLATDQHPDNDVRAGEDFIATIYNRIRNNANLGPILCCSSSMTSMAGSTTTCLRPHSINPV